MRHRKSKHPSYIGDGEVPYALSRTLLRDFGIGKVVLAALETEAWQELFASRLVEPQRRRQLPGKEKPWYTATMLKPDTLSGMWACAEALFPTAQSQTCEMRC
jgi:hypothetical protein